MNCFIFHIDLLRQYNPDVKGAATGFGRWDSPNAKLNVAVPGGIAS